MRLIVEVEADSYESVVALRRIPLSVPEIEVRQADGLLSTRLPVLCVEGIGPFVRAQFGVEPSHPAALLHVARTSDAAASQEDIHVRHVS